jgi:hypothetical protein
MDFPTNGSLVILDHARILNFARGGPIFGRLKALGATGFDVGCKPPGAYRGAVPSLIMLQIIVANDDNYALAA